MLSSHPSAPSTVFLDRILRDLDTQLDRLQSARETIAGLSESAISNEPIFAGPSLPPAESAVAPTLDTAPAPAAVADVEEEAAHPRRRGRPVGSRNRFPATRRARLQHTPEPRALASSIPAGPVVVSAADIARKREAAAAAQLHAAAAAAPAAPAEGTLEALIREVENRRHAA